MKQMRMLGCVLSLLMAAGCMTSCSDQSSMDSQETATLTTTAAIQTAVSGTDGGAALTATLPATEPSVQTTVTTGYVPTGDMDYDGAHEALEKYLSMCRSGDLNAVLNLTNLGKLYDVTGNHAQAGVRYRAKLDRAEQVSMSYDTTEIGRGSSAEETLAGFAEYRTDLQKQMIAAAEDPQKQADLQLRIAILQPAEKLYVFPVVCHTTAGETISQEFFVTQTSGQWMVDLGVLPVLLEEQREYRLTQANANARQLYLAAGTAMNQLHMRGVNVSLADGLYYHSGKDFYMVHMPEQTETQVEIVAAMEYLTWANYNGITECDQVAIAVSNGVCKAVALQRGAETDPLTGAETYYYGCYPNTLTQETSGGYMSIEDVLVHAMS